MLGRREKEREREKKERKRERERENVTDWKWTSQKFIMTNTKQSVELWFHHKLITTRVAEQRLPCKHNEEVPHLWH